VACGRKELKLIVKELDGIMGSDFIWLKMRVGGGKFD
jgi:hypothetical protein